MTTTDHLALPFIDAAQSQKSVTHNESLIMLDCLLQLSVIARNQISAPSNSNAGDRYLVGANPTGSFATHAGQIAAYQNNVWNFYSPQPGWLVFVLTEQIGIIYTSAGWINLGEFAGSINNVQKLGVGTNADSVNIFSAKSNAVLFTARATTDMPSGTGDMRLNMNKSTATNTLSLLYQTNYSGRAEAGLCGDDQYHIKVSSDGTNWFQALVIDPKTGIVSFPNGVAGGVANSLRSGSGAPLISLGNNGDFYIDTVANVLYGPKAAGSWPTFGTSLIGPIGPAGAAGVAGATGPTGAAGPANSLTIGTVTTLPSGSNASATITGTSPNQILNLAIPTATSGSSGAQLAIYRNRIINPSFAINQRGYISGTTLSAGTYAHDRWKAGTNGCAYTFTQNVVDTTITITAGSLMQIVENINVVDTSYILSWTGTAQGRIAINGGSTSGAYASSPIVIPTVNVGQTISVEFSTGTLGKVQLESGSNVNAFERRFYAIEMLLCQRYFYMINPPTGIIGNNTNICGTDTTSNYNSRIHITLPVPMRTAPNYVLGSGSLASLNYASTTAMVFYNASYSIIAPNSYAYCEL